MGRYHKFSILRLAPGGARDERINVGVAIFENDSVDVRLPTKLDKIRVISGALNQAAVRNLADAIDDRDGELRAAGIHDPEARVQAIGQLGPMQLSTVGVFQSNSAAEYEARVSAIFRGLIDPETAEKPVKVKRSRLLSDLKKILRARRILARRDENLDSHRIVTNFSLADGLAADFALKNGAMHFIETVDVSSEDASIRRVVSDVAVSALVLEQARIAYGESNTRTRLVYEANATVEKSASACLDAAAHQGAELYNWSSTADQFKLISTLDGLAIPAETAGERKRRLSQEGTARLRLV